MKNKDKKSQIKTHWCGGGYSDQRNEIITKTRGKFYPLREGIEIRWDEIGKQKIILIVIVIL